MMLTPETSEGMPRSRLRLEVTPSPTPSSPRHVNGATGGAQESTPSKAPAYGNLHFNSQQYRTPSSHMHRLHLPHVSSPLCETPPNPSLAGARVTPRAVPRCLHHRNTPSTSGSNGSHKGMSLTPGRSLIRTPNGVLYNPFELDPDQMKGWVLSPGVFAPKAGPEQSSPFWSIDHIAMMNPADIDEKALQSNRLATPTDPETEEKVQQAIDQFFANDVILPSPWSEGSQKRPFTFPQTPVTPGVVQMTSNTTPNSKDTCTENKKEVSCQTALTLPMDFDLQKVLGKYYTGECKEEGSPDVLSTSSLRRKLFFHGEESSPPSPVQDSTKAGSSLRMDNESPSGGDLCSTPESSKKSQNHTPNSNLFSSSPIHSDSDRAPQTPSLRRCSTAPELMASPELSPIGSSHKRLIRRSASKDTGSVNMATPLCRPLQATPSSGRPSLPFNSPGVSPIRLDGSVMDDCSQEHEDGQRNSTSNKPAARLEFGSSLTTFKEALEEDNSGMEVDRDFSFSKSTGGLNTSAGFKVVRGFTGFLHSVTDQSAAEDQTNLPAHSTQVAQDTGYQTNSLQSLNQDTACHTNLTNQFGSLLPLSARDTGLEEDYNYSSMDFNLADPSHPFSSTRLPSVMNMDESTRDADFKFPSVKQRLPQPMTSCGNLLTTQAGSINFIGSTSLTSSVNQSGSINQSGSANQSDSGLDESLILRQARKALGKPEIERQTSRDDDCSELGKSKTRIRQPTVFASEIQSQWSVTVPTPLRKKLHQVGLIDSTSAVEKELLPSSVALKALQRAGQDCKLYCQPVPTKPSQTKRSIIFKEILTPDFDDPALTFDSPSQVTSS